MRYLILFLMLCVLCLPVSAATVQIYPNGTAVVSVPASQYINVFTAGQSSAKVSKQIGYPNIPSQYTLETSGIVTNQETSFGPYTAVTNVKIEAGTDPVFYSVGSGGLTIPVVRTQSALSAASGSVFRITAVPAFPQLTPATANTTSTLTAANLLTRIITTTQSTGGTITLTLPTGTLLEAALPNLQIGEAFDWTLINLSAAAVDTVTVAAGTDHTIVGGVIVQSQHASTGALYGAAGVFRSRKTAANTFVTYRIN